MESASNQVRYAAPNPLPVSVLLYGMLLLGTVVTLLPYAWMLSSSFKPNVEIFSATVQLIPSQPILGNYTEAIARQPVGRAILNSLIVAGAETVVVVLTSVFTAYPFARLRFPRPGRAVPADPGHHDDSQPGDHDSKFHPDKVAGLGRYLSGADRAAGDGAARHLPDAPVPPDAARGSSRRRRASTAAADCRRCWLVLLPLMGPAMATLAIFTFTASWNEFFWPLIVVQSNEMRTIQLLVAAMKQAEVADWGVIMAVVTLSVVPTVAIYVVLQRYFVKGIAMSGLKG